MEQAMKDIKAWLSQAEAHRRESGRPLVTLSYAQSLDGSITARRGSPLAISGPESSRLTHRLRAAHAAILVGIGTVLADDPHLTVRLAIGNNPQPVILDSRLRTPLDAYLLREHPLHPWIATTQPPPTKRQANLEAAGARLLDLPADLDGHVRLPNLLERLAELGVNSLMVEGGAGIITAFLAQRMVDQVVVTIAPIFVGGLHAVKQAGDAPLAPLPDDSTQGFPRLQNPGYTRLGNDLIVWGKLGN